MVNQRISLRENIPVTSRCEGWFFRRIPVWLLEENPKIGKISQEKLFWPIGSQTQDSLVSLIFFPKTIEFGHDNIPE